MNLFGRRPSTQDSRRKNRDRAGEYPHRDTRPSRRSLERNSRRDSLDERSREGVRMPRTSLQEAINSLFDSLVDFSTSVTHLKDEFDRDVSLVKRYADTKDIEGLWARKVDKSDGRGRDHGRALAHLLDGGAALEIGYRARRTLLKRCLHIATVVTSTSKSKRNAVLAQKLHGMGKGIMKLLHDAAHDQSSIVHLLTELEMLRIFLDRNGACTSPKRNHSSVESLAMEGNSRGRGRNVEQRGRPEYHDDAIFPNPDPLGSPAHSPRAKPVEPEHELADRQERDGSDGFEPRSYPASCQSQGYRHHDYYCHSESPRRHLEYQKRWMPEPVRNSYSYDHPSPRKPRPKVDPGNRKKRDWISSGPEPYLSMEARQDNNHNHCSEGPHPCKDYHEEGARSDGGHKDRQDSHSFEGHAEDGEEARSEGADGKSRAEGEEPGSGNQPEDSGNVGGANGD